MTADEKNALRDAAKVAMNTAIALTAGDPYSGLTAGAALLGAAAVALRQSEAEPEAVQAEQRAAECAGILAIPWPFIYIGSVAWTAAVGRLRDSVPQSVALEPVSQRREAASHATEERAAFAQATWGKLSEAQRKLLTDAGLTPELLRWLGTPQPHSRRAPGVA